MKNNYILYFIASLGFIALFIESLVYTPILEVTLILVIAINFFRFKKQLLPWLLFALVYTIVGAIMAIGYRHAHFLDYLLIYKGFIYYIFLVFLAGKEHFNTDVFIKVFKYFLFVFFLKYVFSKLLQGEDRPILFHENNYELMFLSLFLYLYYILKGKVENWVQIIFAVIVLLSGSKSGILVLLLLFAVFYRKQLISKLHIIIPAILVLFWIILIVLENRMGGEIDFKKIDRVRFLMVFIDEIKDWTFLDFLLGEDRITPLSPEGCGKMSYFKKLFSYSKDGTCYSVMYHSYLMRMLFDHGLLVSFAFLIGYVKMFKVSGFITKQSLVILCIALINGLSVSSFNSVYFALGVGLIFLVKKPKQNYALKD